MSKWRLTARGGAMVRYSNFRLYTARGAADAAESSGMRRGRIGTAIIAAFVCLGLLSPGMLCRTCALGVCCAHVPAHAVARYQPRSTGVLFVQP